MADSLQLFIVDDNRLLREGLVSMLAEQEDIIVVGAAASGYKAIKQIAELRPQVALIDIGMPGKDGIEVTQELRKNAPDVKVIVFGMVDLTVEIMACIEAGAAGYVLKEASFDLLVDTIRAVHRGEALTTPEMAASLFSRIAELASEQSAVNPKSVVKLTRRELQITRLIAKGLANKEIADRLFIATQTVKNHVHNVLDKLQLHTRIAAVQYAREKNLLKNNG